jgi:hypothetical protein
MNRAEMLLAASEEEQNLLVKRMLVKAGVRPKDIPQTAGELLTISDSEYRWSRRHVVDMPSAREAIGQLIEMVRAENRQDHTLDLHGIFIDPETGEILQQPYLRRAFFQLCGMLSPKPNRMADYLLDKPTDERSWNWQRDKMRAVNRKVIARSRHAEGDTGPHLFAFVTENFVPFDPDQYGETMLTTLGDDADIYRCGINYWGTGAAVNLIACDELYHSGAYASARLTSADDASAAVRITSDIYLPNGTRLPVKAGKLIARVLHRGQVTEFDRRIHAGIGEALAQCEPWLELWSDRSKQKLTRDPETLLARLAGGEDIGKAPLLKVPGESAASVTRKLTDTWGFLVSPELVDEKASVADLAHCIAYAAIYQSWSSENARDTLEILASVVLEKNADAIEQLCTPMQPDDDTDVDAGNRDLSDAITERRRLADDWRTREQQAQDEGDEDGAKFARERGALHDITGDVLEETGII